MRKNDGIMQEDLGGRPSAELAFLNRTFLFCSQGWLFVMEALCCCEGKHERKKGVSSGAVHFDNEVAVISSAWNVCSIKVLRFASGFIMLPTSTAPYIADRDNVINAYDKIHFCLGCTVLYATKFAFLSISQNAKGK